MLRNECVGCGACMSVCPNNCISMVYNKEGFFVPEVEVEKCVNCNKCVKVCPIEDNYVPDKTILGAYLFINKDEYIRNVSSSGGFFKALSDIIIDDGGVVFGAFLNSDFMVEHGYTDDKDDLFRFLGSKYVQSYLGDTYRKVKDFLDINRKVLFVGTPCQIAGLRTFLGNNHDNENLTTVELFCEGIPSQGEWKSYLEDYHGNETIRYIQFRYKGKGWWQFGLRLQYLHDDYYFPNRSMKDPWMTAFLKEISINTACYSCKFKCNKKNADFTIGDAWNINRIRTNMDDDRGITTVLINSEKGIEFVRKIQESNHCFNISIEDAVFTRSELWPSNRVPKQREKFMDDFCKNGFRYAFENLDDE